MADHEVRLSTKGLLIRGIDVEFVVRVDGRKRGTLKVSEGSLDWTPARRSTTLQLSWSDFARMVEED